MTEQRRNGNVRVDPQEIPETRPAAFQPGDVVAMTPATLRIGRLATMTPRQLYQIGHKNRWVVLETFETHDEGPCLMINPCCIEYTDWKSKGPRCKGHPAVYFEKVGTVRVPKKGDKSSSLILPLIGDALGLRWEEDEDNPKIVGNALGKDLIGAVGPLARFLKKLAEDQKIL